MHPALLILLCVLFTHLVSLLPKEAINGGISTAFLSIFHRPALSKQRSLKREILDTKLQLGRTSSQDEFAKWAKFRRVIDAKMAELDRVNATLNASRSTLSLLTKAFLFILTTGVPFAVTTYHRKTPIFWIPPAGSWFGPLGWFLALPGAPAGSVSATVWSTVCKRVLSNFDSTVRDFVLVSGLAALFGYGAQSMPPTAGEAVPEQGQPAQTGAGMSEKNASAAEPEARKAGGTRARAAEAAAADGARRRTAKVETEGDLD